MLYHGHSTFDLLRSTFSYLPRSTILQASSLSPLPSSPSSASSYPSTFILHHLPSTIFDLPSFFIIFHRSSSPSIILRPSFFITFQVPPSFTTIQPLFLPSSSSNFLHPRLHLHYIFYLAAAGLQQLRRGSLVQSRVFFFSIAAGSNLFPRVPPLFSKWSA